MPLPGSLWSFHSKRLCRLAGLWSHLWMWQMKHCPGTTSCTWCRWGAAVQQTGCAARERQSCWVPGLWKNRWAIPRHGRAPQPAGHPGALLHLQKSKKSFDYMRGQISNKIRVKAFPSALLACWSSWSWQVRINKPKMPLRHWCHG